MVPMDRLPASATPYPDLVAAWESAIEAFADVADSLTARQWSAPSILPGWTNGDIVAHVVGIEQDLLGEPLPSVDIDWDAAPHADDLFSRYTEIAVAARRSEDQREVCAELRKAIAARRAFMAAEPHDLGETVRGPGGWELPRGVVIRMRCFDIWTHGQDLRAATGEPGDLGTDAAWAAASQMVKGLGRTWAKAVGAPEGSSALVSVTGPGVSFRVKVATGEDGRARAVEVGHEVGSETGMDAGVKAEVEVTLGWPTFAALSTGRPLAEPGDIEIVGNRELGERLLAALNIAP